MIRAKKSLGQNFLIDREVLEKITNVVQIKDKTILEVGPGTGNLTSFILKKNPKKMFVIEKDNDLAINLSETFKDQLTIINDDILQVDENLIFKNKVTVFGNLPYNISTEILSKWITQTKDEFWFNNLILMFQKEVADRIIAKFNTSDYGRLSILSNWKLNVEKICDIKPESFSPRPKIDSSLLFFSPKKNFYKIKDPKNLEKITRIFFNHRRKMLKKPFNQLFNGDQRVLNELKIDLNLRPQNLDFDTYYQLTCAYENLRS
ncbi:16S rRNA (adenine(1518)-N(6)/adenine(1519)-N(6))-dimethyltransferase RsmA [Candidatus Pelagibacter sp.]|nr:16S rRNA (adenine(1518)-N(6)/adenine(1519)-N(6))-dimethyltransferase RsmA [Candidatus Pelagibacter sp.]